MPRIHVNDVDLYYEESGAGEPLVAVHGGWGDHHNWDLVAPGLGRSFRVVTYDRRGHSQSERPGNGTRRDDEDDLAALIEALDGGPAHVAANSFGGSIALGLAARRPELVRSVVAHEPPLLSLIGDDPVVQAIAAKIQAVADQIEAGDVEGGVQRFMEEIALGPGAWEQLPAPIRQISIHNAPTYVNETRDPDWKQVDRTALAGLPMPVLLTKGDGSPAWFFGIVAELARVIPGSQVSTFAGAGHVPHMTHPEDYVATVTRFVGQTVTAAI